MKKVFDRYMIYGFSDEDIRALKFAYRKLFLDKKTNVNDSIPAILEDEKYGSNPRIQRLIEFIRTSERGFIH